MSRRDSMFFIWVLCLFSFFLFSSCAKKVVKEEEKVTPTTAVKPAEEKVEVAKPAEEKPAETKVPEIKPITIAPEKKEEVKEVAKAPEAEVAKAPEAPKIEEELKEADRRREAEERAFTTVDINFDFDKYDLKPRAREILADKAHFMKNYPTVKVLIEGHCDERGTNEYNLALGERRARAAMNYLISLGIDANRISIISYGEERPLDPGHNEEAWAKNRRAHFVITSK
jgi:peptidoglycan-associated lipoprotein